MKNAGNTIHESIVLETDCPSNHQDRKLPILDLKVWLQETNGRQKIMHEFYQKEVSAVALYKCAVNATMEDEENDPRTGHHQNSTELSQRPAMGRDS